MGSTIEFDPSLKMDSGLQEALCVLVNGAYGNNGEHLGNTSGSLMSDVCDKTGAIISPSEKRKTYYFAMRAQFMAISEQNRSKTALSNEFEKFYQMDESEKKAEKRSHRVVLAAEALNQKDFIYDLTFCKIAFQICPSSVRIDIFGKCTPEMKEVIHMIEECGYEIKFIANNNLGELVGRLAAKQPSKHH